MVNAEARDLDPLVEIRSRRFGRVGARPGQNFTLAHEHDASFDLCLVVGTTRADVCCQGYTQEVQPYHAFAMDDPRGPCAMQFRGKVTLLSDIGSVVNSC